VSVTKTSEDGVGYEFDLTLEEQSIKLKGKDGVSRDYILKELTGFQRDKYLESESPKMDAARRSVKNFTDVQASLIAKCLFEVGQAEPVPLKDIRDYPSRVQHRLYKMCLEINGFGEEGELAAKNA
jgi:hypothetical protein